LALRDGIAEVAFSDADQIAFDKKYLEDAERNAKALSRYDIDGMSVLRTARASVQADGTVQCAGGVG
jgi:hypothetical protein